MSTFGEQIVAWQHHSGRRGLPWQDTRDPYRIWLSEIMLQQTQVSTVVPYYTRFLARLPTLPDLAAAPLEHVLELWSGLGYYSRARNLHACARQVMDRHGGVFPRGVEEVAALPGIGRSTAAAICAFAYGERAAILDGNVKRVLARYRGIDGFPGDGAVERTLWKAAEALLPPTDIEAYTQALMDLGATVCVRARPACLACPVRETCVAFRTGRAEELPAARPRKPLPERAATCLMLSRGGEVMLQRRPPTGIWGGLWSLPELPEDTSAQAWCRTHYGATVDVRAPLPCVLHTFTHFRLTITPLPCRVQRIEAKAQEPGLLWLGREDIAGAALPAPIKRLLLDASGAF